MSKIICLFSIDNNYDQPAYNLVAWWSTKPSLQQLGTTVGYEFPCKDDEHTLAIVNLWSMKEVEFHKMGPSYRLEEVEEGIPLNDF